MDRYHHPAITQLFDPAAQIGRWVAVERTVAQVQANLGLIPPEAARAIARADPPTTKAMQEAERATGHDVAAFLHAFGLNIDPDYRRWLHHGMTSSDLVDTAASMEYQRVDDVIFAELHALGERVEKLAFQHRGTARAARTHGRIAEPTTFGLQLERHYDTLLSAAEILRTNQLPMKLSGAVGNYTYNPPQVEHNVGRSLGLPVDWAADQAVRRSFHAMHSFAYVMAANAIEKLATEIRVGAQSGIDELSEGFQSDQVGSTAMPHKRNPVRAERLCGLARVVRGLLFPVVETAAGMWGERDISNSSVERTAQRDQAILLGWMAREATDLIGGLQVDAARMWDTLHHGLTLPTPAALLYLSVKLGGVDRETAHSAISSGRGPTLPMGADQQPYWDACMEATDLGWYLQHLPHPPAIDRPSSGRVD